MSNVHRNLLVACNNGSWLVKHSLKSNPIILKMASSQATDQMVVPKEDVVRFIADCFTKSGTTPEDGRTIAHHLMTADYTGHFSHGLNRMQMYLEDLKSKLIDPVAKTKVVTDFQAIALVDGNNGLGQVIGKFCMELVMEKAKKFGIGMVAVRGSNHYGVNAYYTRMAVEQGLIGFTCTNTSPLMAPTRSKKAALGTNPLSLGMRATGGDSFILDMATTAVALGKIELAIKKNEPIPMGWALGTDGKPTTNSEDAYKASVLMPLGGDEKNSGYKGFGLGLMVEVLCGILSGSAFGPNIREWKNKDKIANLGQCFMAIDQAAFGPGSEDRLAKLLQQLRNLPTVGDKPVVIPGDMERVAMARVEKEGGIAYHPNQLKASKEFAESMGVQPMKLVPKKVV